MTLLSLGARASINAKDNHGRTALMYVKPAYYQSASPSESPTVRTLIQGGANVNAVDENGQTPLMILAAAGHGPGIITALLEGGAGASINAKDKWGNTSLMIAVRNESLKIEEIKLLL